MSNLPDIKKFKKHTLKLSELKYFSDSPPRQNYDLEKMYRLYKKAYENQKDLVRSIELLELPKDVDNPTALLYELFDKDFLRSLNNDSNHKILKRFIGYSKYYKSLTISILDENDKVMSIAIRKAFDKDGNQIKWKTYGSKTYVATKLLDSIVFLGVGTAEYVLFELLGVSYLLLQSDSMYRHIPKDVIKKLEKKSLVLLKENDESFEKLIEKLKEIFDRSNIYVIDFEKILGKKLKHGFDFRDFCNEIKDVAVIEQLIQEEILEQMKDKK